MYPQKMSVVTIGLVLMAHLPTFADTLYPNDDVTLRGSTNYNATSPFGLFVKNSGDVSYMEYTLGSVAVTEAKLVLWQGDTDVENPWTIVVKGDEYNFDEATITSGPGPTWPVVVTFDVTGTTGNPPVQAFYEVDLTSWYNNNLGKTMSLFITRNTQPAGSGPIFEDKEGTKTGDAPTYGPRLELVGEGGDEECPESDMDDDCDVEVQDLQIFLAQWLGVDFPTLNLIAHWKMDGDPHDSAGDHNGTVYGNPIWDPNGYINGALNCDGQGDYVEVPADEELNVEQITMAAWVKPDDPEPSQRMFVLNREMTYPGTYTLWLDNINYKWGAHVRLDGDEANGILVYSKDVATTDWTHIAAIYDGANLKLYIDGVLQPDTANVTGSIDPDNSGILILGAHASSLLNFAGSIDDVRIYDRALSAGEIGILANKSDLNKDGSVNLNDYNILADEWLVGTAVTITRQPENLTVYEGNTAAFSVAAEGAEPISYQWQKNSIDLSDAGDISGATTNELQIVNTEVSDEGQYRCVVSNKYNTVISDEATLTVTTTNRRYILYVPTDYNPPQKLYPLIISSHGTSQNGDTEMDSTGPNSGWDNGTPTWPTLAEDNDVIVACPDMTGAYGESGCAISPTHLTQLATDDTAVMAIIDEIEATYDINTSRIMLTGFSGGGNVVHYVGLRHPDVFNAICSRHGNFHEDGTPGTLPDGATDMNTYIFTGTNDGVCGTNEAIAWYTAQGFNYLDTDYFSTWPSSEHTTDRHHALDWFLNSNLGISAGGHYVRYNGETLMLVGDSGTQCAAQNSNLDHREWIDDCASRGIRAVHIWSFVAVRQKQDESQIEDRWGYVIPDVVPWARNTSGTLAYDQRYQWNLQAFDEGAEGDMTHYWPRLRDMCSYAKSKNVVVGITMFTGWSKHDYSWIFHPLNITNGGHLTNKEDAVIIDTPGTEVWQESYSGAWSNAKKTQWVWEQMSIKFINELGPLGNVFFVFFDEHSYSEGNMGDHFRDFFRSRGQVWMDWNARRSTIDWVMSGTFSGDDRNSNAVSGFIGSPARPYFNLEGSPYLGDDVREAIWTFSIGGGNYLFHADENQETVQTGIMGYDPYVPGGDKGMYKRDWLGHASTFFNQHVDDLDSLAPANGLTSSTPDTYCLADNGREYVVYSMINAASNFTIDLSAASGKTLNCRFYNPRTGIFNSTFQRAGGSSAESFSKPDSNDWVLHILEN